MRQIGYLKNLHLLFAGVALVALLSSGCSTLPKKKAMAADPAPQKRAVRVNEHFTASQVRLAEAADPAGIEGAVFLAKGGAYSRGQLLWLAKIIDFLYSAPDSIEQNISSEMRTGVEITPDVIVEDLKGARFRRFLGPAIQSLLEGCVAQQAALRKKRERIMTAQLVQNDVVTEYEEGRVRYRAGRERLLAELVAKFGLTRTSWKHDQR